MLYPPILNSFQPAFTIDTLPYTINCTLSNLMTQDEFEHIQINITYQSNNQSIANTDLYPDGIIYKDKSKLQFTNNIISISIDETDLLIHKWESDTYYKVQIRFGSNKLWIDKSDFSNWKAEAIAKNYFSEWSTVMILKAITEPIITIKNNSYLEYSTNPIFYGSYKNTGNESEDLYKFELYKDNQLIEESNWLQHNVLNDQNDNSIDSYRFKTTLLNNNIYSVVYYVQTINYFITNSDSYLFRIQETAFNELKNIQFISKPIEEDACVDLFLSSNDLLTGNYIISRSSEKDNFTTKEDLYSFSLYEQAANNLYIYTDYSIENGIKYQYSLYKIQFGDIRSLPLYDEINPIIQVNFEDSYLVGENGLQLKLKFNTNLTSFKHNLLLNKQHSLGSKYPIIQRNGNLYYAEFPINSLISIHSDNNSRFFKLKEDGYYYKNDLIIDKEKINQLDTNLSQNNLFIEKIFRDKVEEFLNSENFKLFKSPTEGNYIVSLMNTSLSPNTTLNRFLYTFSTTAYEIMDFNLYNLKQYNIISYKEDSLDSQIKVTNINQIFGTYDNRINLMDIIKEKVNIKTDEYDYKFESLNSFSIQSGNNKNLIIFIDGQEIHIPSGKIYSVNNYTPMQIYVQQESDIIINFSYNATGLKIENNFYNFNFKPYLTWGQIAQNTEKEVSLFELIQNASKNEIENLLELSKNSLSIYDEKTGIWTNEDRNTFYSFLNIDVFDLEAPQGTQIEMTDDKNKKTILIIGPTNRLNLSLQEQKIRNIKILSVTTITLNYTALVLYSKESEENV